jgi:hypothetical protein
MTPSSVLGLSLPQALTLLDHADQARGNPCADPATVLDQLKSGIAPVILAETLADGWHVDLGFQEMMTSAGDPTAITAGITDDTWLADQVAQDHQWQQRHPRPYFLPRPVPLSPDRPKSLGNWKTACTIQEESQQWNEGSRREWGRWKRMMGTLCGLHLGVQALAPIGFRFPWPLTLVFVVVLTGLALLCARQQSAAADRLKQAIQRRLDLEPVADEDLPDPEVLQQWGQLPEIKAAMQKIKDSRVPLLKEDLRLLMTAVDDRQRAWRRRQEKQCTSADRRSLWDKEMA